MTEISKEVELEALNRSIALWTPLITELQAMDEATLNELEEYDIQTIKELIDPEVAIRIWNCYLCAMFWNGTIGVDCERCCVGIACGPCKDDDFNEYKILVNPASLRIKRLRAANRILRAMKARRKQLQSEVAFRLHQKMWRELAETGHDRKPWLKGVRNNCYLCQYVVDKAGKLQDDICRKHCPAIWPIKSERTYWAAPCEESYYGLWRDSCFPDDRQKLAKKIANLEYRKEAR